MAVLPVFLVGVLSVEIRSDFSLTERDLGLLVALFWGGMGLTGVPGGRFAQRLGGTTAVRIGSLVAMLSLLGIGLVSVPWQLYVLMLIAGAGSGFANPATDLAIAEGIEAFERPWAFGIKQGSVPVAALLAGLAVPLVVTSLGWRAAFFSATVFGLATVLVVPGRSCTERTQRALNPANKSAKSAKPSPRLVPGIVLFASAAGLNMAAMTATSAYYVESAVASGTTLTTAAWVLSLGTSVSALSRFFVAWRLSVVKRPHLVSVSLMLLGAVGTVGLASTPRVPLLAVSTVFAFGAGWGWNALFVLAMVKSNNAAPARAMGVVVAMTGLGGVVGPLVFGSLVQSAGYATGWITIAAVQILSATLMFGGERRSLRRGSSSSVGG